MDLVFLEKADIVIVAAGGLPGVEPEAKRIKRIMMESGIPGGDIYLDDRSTNTWENTQFSRKLIEDNDCGVPLLVTSAWHMPRAVGAFERVGVSVTSVPADYRADNVGGFSISDLVPSKDHFGKSNLAVREWLGRLVYTLREWN